MALIKVGIHENLTITSKSKINEHGTLELVVGTVADNNALLDAFTSNTTFSGMESSIRFYPPNLVDFDKKTKTPSEVGKDLLTMRHQFMQYGLVFTTKEKVEEAIGGMKMFEGLGIPPEEIGKAIPMLVREEFLKKVTTTLSTRFLKLLETSGAFDGKILFRQKFLRQSKDKNYAVVPTSDFDVWIEPMSIPKTASKIAYSKWELDNNKHDPNPVSGDASQTDTVDAAKAADLFNAPAPEAPSAAMFTTPELPSTPPTL